MDYLSALGFDAYVATGLTATATRWIPPHVVHERLTSLRSLVLPGSREAALWDWYRAALFDTAPGFAYLSGGGESSEWPSRDVGSDGDIEVKMVSSDGQAAEAKKATAKKATARSTPRAPEPPPPMVVQLIVGRSHGLRRVWQFHKGDPDPYPSVPHGHVARDSGRALWLDPYQGWVYDRQGRIEREPRAASIALWNDDKFRMFASESLQHMLAADPTFANRVLQERGVRDPLILPSKR